MKTLFTLLICIVLTSCYTSVRMAVQPKSDDEILGTYHTHVTRARMGGYLIKVKGEYGWLLMPIPFQRKDSLTYSILKRN